MRTEGRPVSRYAGWRRDHILGWMVWGGRRNLLSSILRVLRISWEWMGQRTIHDPRGDLDRRAHQVKVTEVYKADSV
jgi:hypothetical protein